MPSGRPKGGKNNYHPKEEKLKIVKEMLENNLSEYDIERKYNISHSLAGKWRKKYIIFPQLMSYIIPVFKNESVSLIKLTSIAGYISIMDLTKAGDIIRYRTYEAFFPLIFIALIYFILCFIISKLLDLVYKKVNPRKEKRI